jgi:hypothetical protein
MIDINKIKGKNVMYTGELSELLTNGSFYTIGIDEDDGLFTIDDVGVQHWLSEDWLVGNFDVREFLDVVGKYVRYKRDDSAYIRDGDIGIIMRVDGDGDYWVRWLNPNMEQSVRGWCTSHRFVEFV